VVSELVRKSRGWLESRTGAETSVRQFLMEDIPASAGWPQVFGSVALFLLLTQALTGILLAINYAASPDESYRSVTYIMREVTAGRMIRGLHHWGASFMIVGVVLHMAQVFLYGAYKKPREVTWIVGVFLLLLTLSFGLTGYLLPWDNRAYWATMVTVHIASQAPLAGSYLVKLAGAKEQLGALTLSRFYALHVLILPGATAVLIAFHLFLVRRHGVAPAAETRASGQKFYPRQAFRDVVAVFITFVILFLAAALVDAPIDRMADPTDTAYVPRPDWYFLFLFQTLKVFRGPLESIGSIGLPTLAVLALFAVPFVDRTTLRRVRQRVTAIAIIALSAAIWGALTFAAVAGSPPSTTPGALPGIPIQSTQFPADELAGVGLFRRERCGVCHNLVSGEPKEGPNLAGADLQKPREWRIVHFNNPNRQLRGAGAGVSRLPLAELNALSVLLAKLTAEHGRELEQAPQSLIDGAEVYAAHACGSCHRVNGSGGEIGPSLNGVALRRSRQWILKHFAAPQTLSPGSVMPPYRFSKTEEDAILTYLLSLPE
jgi:ubiquinol-cytochrome c reductase cytochrome b subunit